MDLLLKYLCLGVKKDSDPSASQTTVQMNLLPVLSPQTSPHLGLDPAPTPPHPTSIGVGQWLPAPMNTHPLGENWFMQPSGKPTTSQATPHSPLPDIACFPRPAFQGHFVLCRASGKCSSLPEARSLLLKNMNGLWYIGSSTIRGWLACTGGCSWWSSL